LYYFDRLKGGIGYVLLVIGALFVLKGVLAYRKQQQAQCAPPVVEITEEAPLISVNDAGVLFEEVSVLRVSDVLCCHRTSSSSLNSCLSKTWTVLRPVVLFAVCIISGCLAGEINFCFPLTYSLILFFFQKVLWA
jgi:hypothetical protein